MNSLRKIEIILEGAGPPENHAPDPSEELSEQRFPKQLHILRKSYRNGENRQNLEFLRKMVEYLIPDHTR